ncbi:MAG TPA: DUF1800 domain-containing protein, partial [Actinomycetes bacterium]|nr:DUF1800 domain-containing protein [Actinomycetes bacterium]
AGFGARPDEVDAAVATGYEATVERLLGVAGVAGVAGPDTGADGVPLPSFSAPVPASQLPAEPEARRAAQQAEQRTQREEGQRLVRWWVDRMVTSTAPLREKLTLFWHGHFATSVQKVKEPELMYDQNQLFRRSAAGNFEALAQAVAKDPAMLIWLDSNQNRKQSPNENFARELFELFTLGLGRYTEADIKDAARAFTGWQYRRQSGTFAVVANLHDTGQKTVLGQTGNLGGEDVVRLACRQPACASFVAAALWSRFAHPVSLDDPVVRDVVGASGFARDLDVGRLMGAVFRHPAFLGGASRTGLVKEPIAYVAGTLRALGLRAGSPGINVVQTLSSLGQLPFSPPNVGGWPQNGYWLTTSFALARLRFASAVVQRANLSPLSAVSSANRPGVAARMLTVDEWGPVTAGALTKAAADPKAMMTLALVSPEYVLA